MSNIEEKTKTGSKLEILRRSSRKTGSRIITNKLYTDTGEDVMSMQFNARMKSSLGIWNTFGKVRGLYRLTRGLITMTCMTHQVSLWWNRWWLWSSRARWITCRIHVFVVEDSLVVHQSPQVPGLEKSRLMRKTSHLYSIHDIHSLFLGSIFNKLVSYGLNNIYNLIKI